MGIEHTFSMPIVYCALLFAAMIAFENQAINVNYLRRCGNFALFNISKHD